MYSVWNSGDIQAGKYNYPSGLGVEIPQLFGQVVNELLGQFLESRPPQMDKYLGGTRLLYRVLGVSIGIPVQQGDVAEGIKSPSMGGIAYRMYFLLQWGCLMPDHHQEDLGEFAHQYEIFLLLSIPSFSTPAAEKIWPIHLTCTDFEYFGIGTKVEICQISGGDSVHACSNQWRHFTPHLTL